MVFRIAPNLPPQAYQTYTIAAPKSTHWRPATCEEIDCDHFLNGWMTVLDLSTEIGRRLAYELKHDKTRTFHVEKITDVIFRFTYPAGQKCFNDHEVRIGNQDIYLVKGGDWRGNPTGYRYIHKRAEDWVDDFQANQQAIADVIERG